MFSTVLKPFLEVLSSAVSEDAAAGPVQVELAVSDAQMLKDQLGHSLVEMDGGDFAIMMGKSVVVGTDVTLMRSDGPRGRRMKLVDFQAGARAIAPGVITLDGTTGPSLQGNKHRSRDD